jgi:predicted AlkP superfamily phosphohydrolase/phosphomutase
MSKVIVIGLDAACLDIILPWIKSGHLPYLSALLSKGVYTELKSTIPPVTASAWPSLFTGKNPGKHGIFSFFRQKEGHQSKLVSSTDNKARAIWEYLSDAGKNSIVINVPITHPARKINGILIPGFMAPENPICHPIDILEEVNQALGPYRIYSEQETKGASPEKILQGFIEVTKTTKDTAIYLGKKYDWDFLMVQFQKTDTIFHRLKSEKHHLQLYKFVDQCIREIVEALGVDANVLIVSDHGMGRCNWTFYINSWLKKEGFVKAKRPEMETATIYLEKTKLTGHSDLSYRSILFGKVIDCLSKMGVSFETINSWLPSLHLGFLKSIVPPGAVAKVPQTFPDEEYSSAYCAPNQNFGIRINSQNGEEYQKHREQLISKFKLLTDPDGNLLFESVMLREDYYNGPHMADAPDIVFTTREMNCRIIVGMPGRLFSPYKGYNHKMNGLFAGTGNDIVNAGYLGNTLSIYDIAPTILHMFGLPVPTDMDGRIITEIFKKGSEPAEREIKYQAADTEKERIKDRIKRLKESGKL